MPAYVNVGGTWRPTVQYVNVGGTWRDAPQQYVNVGGTWRPLYTFSWNVGAWGDCVNGSQSRSVTCTRSDGHVYGDNVCTSFGAGAKPAVTQSCTSCQYDGINYYWSVSNGISYFDSVLRIKWAGVQVADYDCGSQNCANSITSYAGYTRGAFVRDYKQYQVCK